MRKLLNTLYVTTQGAYLRKEGQTVVVEIDKKATLRVPLLNLQGILCFGNVLCSPFLMGACAKTDVSLAFLTEHGRFLADVRGEVTGNVLLRREQGRQADDEQASLRWAKVFVAAKLQNARITLRRAVRDRHGDAERIERMCQRIRRHLHVLKNVPTMNEVRGIEGDTAKHYFAVFDEMIVQQKDAFFLQGRNRRPPRDNMNALLSFLYTLVFYDLASALSAHGLDPFVGFLHRDRPGRRSLALDFLEEFRTSLADRLALTLVNRRQIQAHDFIRSEAGGVTLDEDGRKLVLKAYQEKKQEERLHPFFDERMKLGLLFHAQAMLAARTLRGDLDTYPAFYWK